jgi:hypothetical protein
VVVYQFNALEYKGSDPSCPGLQPCILNGGQPIGCFSFSNDASLLLPSTAMTGNYRVAGLAGAQGGILGGALPSFVTITGTQDGTMAQIKLAANGKLLAGGQVQAMGGGSTATVMLGAGDVVELLSDQGSDLSGSVVKANKPVQVIAGVSCITNPPGVQSCDHVEESVFPAETIGKHYIVTVPSNSRGSGPFGHTVRLYGNVDNTKLTFNPAVPNAPATLSAGQVVDLGVVKADFEVTGDQPFLVGSFLVGGSQSDPNQMMPEGDPSETLAVAVEQFRLKYVFLSPSDYDFNYVDVAMPAGTTLTLDGNQLADKSVKIGSGMFNVMRINLTGGNNGAHTLEATQPVGIQVVGYGIATSYQYPGGLDLAAIAAPPIF